MFRTVVSVSCLFLVACGVQEQDQEEIEGVSETAVQEQELSLSSPINLNTWGISEATGTRLNDLVREHNEFFDDLGTNRRTCESCHSAAEGFTIRPEIARLRFLLTSGLDPLFRPVDGANSPLANVKTLAGRRAAYSLLLKRGVIRVGIGIPAGAEFELLMVEDPYSYATANELSLFRRPLPATNLRFNVTVMWDGRESRPGQTLTDSLASQAAGATRGHAQQPMPLAPATFSSIVDFETAIFQAQSYDFVAKELHGGAARGGAAALALEPFTPTANVSGFDLFTPWVGLTGSKVNDARASIARGQALFSLPRPAGRCSFCHDVRNVGTNVRGTLFDIGVSVPERRAADVPLYTLRNLATGAVRQTTDPGRALITGLWRDVDRFKVPTMRGVAARAPYFHDGSAATLDDVVDHYERQFNFTLTAQEQADLVAFMRAL